MSITVADLLKLPCLEDAKVEAGACGLKGIVSSISVLEYSEPTNLQISLYERNKVFLGGELVISGFVNIKDNVKAQCESIRRMHDAGEVGLILYYVGIFVPVVHKELSDIADSLNFPLICLPEHRMDLRYSEVIRDVMEAIFKDQMQQKYFVGEMLERISHLLAAQRTLANVLRMLSDRIRCTLILSDRHYEILDQAAWPMSATDYLKEVLFSYKNRRSHEIDKLYLSNTRQIYTKCCMIHSDNHVTLHLILVSEKAIDTEQMAQSAEIVRLFINIWSDQEGNVGTTELIRSIIQDEPIKMRRLAEIMHIHVASFHTMWIISLREKNLSLEEKESENLSLLSKTHTFFKQQKIHFVADIFENRLIVFFEELKFADEIHSLMETFIKGLTDADKRIILFYRTGLESTTAVRNTYTLLNLHLKDACAVYPRKMILTHQELLFAAHCAEMIEQGEEKVQENLAPLVPLRSYDKEETLISTLAVYLLDVQASTTEAAKILYVHKNTVKYRLRKIDELLNYNIRKLPETFRLYVAVATRRILSVIKKDPR